VPTQRHNEVNGSARLVLNIHRDSMVANGWSPATRMFEAAGAAACQVTDSWRGIEEFFEPGAEILVAEDAEAVASFVRSIDDATADAIGERARLRALRDHTYDQRAMTLDALLRQVAGSAT
jgi:spore maturation protein CgeB